jgi:hypothetical protein
MRSINPKRSSEIVAKPPATHLQTIYDLQALIASGGIQPRAAEFAAA